MASCEGLEGIHVSRVAITGPFATGESIAAGLGGLLNSGSGYPMDLIMGYETLSEFRDRRYKVRFGYDAIQCAT